VLQLQGITKRFGALVANNDISLALERGEVLALLGENGAGKSTLVSILFGHYVADAGQILVDGQPLPPGDPAAALAAGIGMVHQHFTLADNLSVLDNVMLGTESLWQPFSRRKAARAALAQTAQRFGLQVNPEARIADLSVGERQRVEIIKALMPFGRKVGARILILDEPTAVLTPQESESLFETLGQLVAQGLSIIFISHKLDEVLRVSHRIAVLRAGQLVAQLPAAGASKGQLAQAMVGREVQRLSKPVRPVVQAAPPVCSLQGVTVRGHGAWPQLDDVNLQLQPGEVVAIAGVVRRDAALAYAQGLVQHFDVRGLDDAGLYTRTRALSGGNMQKLILGRALTAPVVADAPGDVAAKVPPLIVANQPTWGLDIGAVAYVHQQLLNACAAGAALLLISEDLDEIFALADRIAVMHHGRLSAARPAADWSLADIGLAMAGSDGVSHAA
jgi:simple sugar transport system ATP-binding protein